MLNTLRAYSGLIRLALVVLLLFLTAGYAGMSLVRYFEVAEVQLPDLVGVDKDAAAAQLTELGLEPVTFSEVVASAEVNAVTSQSPRPGATVREGRSVSLGVNPPAASVAVPALNELSEGQARVALNDLGLELGEVAYTFDDAPEGQIITQTPEQGAALAAGATVDVVVSRGPDVAKVRVPQVRGLNIEAAKRRLSSLGFTNIDTTATSVSFDRPLTVTNQVPTPGEEVPLSTQIMLQYSLSTRTVVRVPTLTGLPLGRAQTLLRSTGLTLGPVSYISDPEQPGGIVSYQPDDTTLNGAPVGLTINSSGSPSESAFSPFPNSPDTTFTVEPDVPVAPNDTFSASPDISDPFGSNSGNNSTSSIDSFTGSDPPGSSPNSSPTITPDSGTPLGQVPGATGNARTLPFTFDPTNLGMGSLANRDYKLALRVVDDQGERTVFEEVVPPGGIVTTSVTVYGDALLQTYLNDILFQAWNP